MRPVRSAGPGAVEHPSPNHGARRGREVPDMVVLHYTGMESADAALARLCDPAAEVSAHWLIAEDGRVWRLVDEALRAWHAGVAGWGGVEDVNSRSIGIELANPGTGSEAHPFPEPQMAALEAVLGTAMAGWDVPPERVVGHACVAPGRKIDPGPRFDWRRLALAGLAIWYFSPASAGPAPPSPGGTHPPARRPGGGGAGPVADVDPVRFRQAAREFGYPLAVSGGWDAAALDVWRAFARRFRPAEVEAPTAAGLAALERLAARWPARPAACG